MALRSIVVIQDLDDRPGCGSFRDLSASAKDFQIIGGRVGSTHAHIHIVDLGTPQNVIQAANDDVIHTDIHGAVVIPAHFVKLLQEEIDLVARREKVMLDLCASEQFDVRALCTALAASKEIH